MERCECMPKAGDGGACGAARARVLVELVALVALPALPTGDWSMASALSRSIASSDDEWCSLWIGGSWKLMSREGLRSIKSGNCRLCVYHELHEFE